MEFEMFKFDESFIGKISKKDVERVKKELGGMGDPNKGFVPISVK